MTAPYAHLFGGEQSPPKKPNPYAHLLEASHSTGAHGTSGSWGDDDEKPSGILEQIKEGAGQVGEAVRHLPSTLGGMATSALHDADIVGRLLSVGMGGPSEGVEDVPTREMLRAGVNTAANLALPLMGPAGPVARVALGAGLGALNDSEKPIRGATAGVLLGETIHGATKGLRAARGSEEAPGLKPPEPSAEEIATSGPPERNLGLSLAKATRDKIRNAYRSTMVTPYASIEEQAPALADALLTAGASDARAKHIATVRIDRVLKGLNDEDRAQFGAKLTYDNVVAEAARKRAAAAQATDPAEAATLTQAADNFDAHAAKLAPRIRPNVEQEPWFQRALGQYKTDIEGPLTQDALASGVDPNSLRKPASAYVRLASEARMDDAEIRRALDVAGVSDPADLRQRPALLRKLIGENPALERYFARNAHGPRQGPLAPNAGYPGEPGPLARKQVGVTGSSKMAQGTAQDYVTDVSRVVDFDARDKAVKASRNRIWQEVAAVGRKLDQGEAPGIAKKVISFDDKNGLTTGDTGTQRYEVTPEVYDAVNHFARGSAPQSAGRAAVQRFSDFATRAQIAGMPVEATSHANTLASLVSKVPGEKDAIGKGLAAIPGLGSKAATIREMLGVDFNDPQIQALENRLADIGALRIQEPHSGLINTSHNFLFGPTGVDKRARLVLARKYLARNPEASNADLREFITSQTGNYNSQNAGALPNFMAKGSVISPFARFQAARIPTSIKRTLGMSDLPASSNAQRFGDIAQTLYRGPVGYALGSQALNYALSGHPTQDNEAGHALDVNTGLVAAPGGLHRMTPEQGQAAYGERSSPVYLPAATLDPVTYAGLRATGLRALLPPLSPEQPAESRIGNAVRDQANVALGTAGPFMRMLQTALTGTQPYLQPDNTLLRVAPKNFGATSELAGQVKTALGLANPAVHAFTASGGDASRTLAGAMAEDGKMFGGPASLAARVAEFTMPRVLAPSMGGRSNEQSMDIQRDRRFREAMVDYGNRVKRAPGAIAREEIIADAARDAERNGFDPQAVIVALQKVEAKDQRTVRDDNDQRVKRHIEKIRP